MGNGGVENGAVRFGLTAASAFVAEAATYPIDMTKTRLQLQGELSAAAGQSRKGAWGMAVHIARQEGLRGLYKGISPAVCRHFIYTPIRIGIYEELRSAVAARGEVNAMYMVGIGATAGVIGQAIASPADLVKVRMQADGRLVAQGHPPRYRGMADAVIKIVRQEGTLGLWKGVGVNSQRAALVNMGELATYDQSKRLLLDGGMADNVVTHTVASIVSGFFATLFSCPADVIKTRIMNMREGGAQYTSSLDCLVKTVRLEGFMALYKGFLPTWARLGPWQLAFWVSYEKLRQLSHLSSF